MNIIWAFIFTSMIISNVLQASQSDAPSDKEKSSTAKNASSKKSPPKEKQPAQKTATLTKEKSSAQKQPASKEKTATPAAAPAQKKLKPSAASTAALLQHSTTPGYIAPFESIEKKPDEQKSASSASVKVQAQPQILQKNTIFQAPTKVQNLGDIEIGNSSKKSLEITAITFSYSFTDESEHNQKPNIHTKTHKITFPRGHIIPAQKKLAFTITMKNNHTLQFAGIKSIETYSGMIVFDHPITDLSKPIVLNLSKKGKIQYCA